MSATPASSSTPVRPQASAAESIITVYAHIEYNNTGYVSIYVPDLKRRLPFPLAGFGYTEDEALAGFYEIYLLYRIECMQQGQPQPEIKFRFVRHKPKTITT